MTVIFTSSQKAIGEIILLCNLQVVSRYRHELSGPPAGLSDAHVRRLLQLAYLAPNIVRKLCGKKKSG